MAEAVATIPVGSGISPSQRALRHLASNPATVIAFCILVVMALSAIIIPAVTPKEWASTSSAVLEAPSATHWFGTDVLGRDLFRRVFVGARVSLLVGLAGAVVSLFIGTAYGLISGYFGGKIDAAMMRFVDLFYAIPRLILVLFFINTFDDTFRNAVASFAAWSDIDGLVPYSRILLLVISLGLIEWLTMARVVRGQVLAIKSQQYVTAAAALGQSHTKIILRHLLPNVAGVVVVYLTLTIPAVILDESFLSFLGLGVEASQASWGTLLKDGAQSINPIQNQWWLVVFPAIAMSLTLLALNFLGDGLRDALDVRGKR